LRPRPRHWFGRHVKTKVKTNVRTKVKIQEWGSIL
jgi:hypothetical protein